MKTFVKFLTLLAILSMLSVLTACHLPSWPTYTNATYGFQLQYPPGGSVVTDTPTAARIQLPFAAGTNLAEKYVDISVVDGASPCITPEAAGYAPGSLSPVHVTIHGLDWTKVSGGEGAAGSMYQWTGYSTASGTVCVSLTFVLHSHPSGLYSTPPPEFDPVGESHVFETIVDTFAWIGAGPHPTPVSSFTPTAAFSPTPTPVVSSTPTYPAPSGWLTYINLAYGFQLNYPPGGGGLQPGDTAVAARIDLPFAPGTNLTEKYLEIAVTDGASTCESPEAAGYAPGYLTPVPVTLAGLVWEKENAGEGAAGSVYTWVAYSTVSGSVCVSLTFILHSHPPDLWPTPPPTFDEAGESVVFEQIVETFLWLSGAGVTPTTVATWTPTPVAFSFTPHLNAYCRFGPDPVFDSLDVAMKGQAYLIDGQDAAHAWFRIMLEPNKYCWVLQSTGSATGDLSKLRVLLSPPTPTPTPVPIDCKLYTTKNACNAVRACTWHQINDKTGLCTSK